MINSIMRVKILINDKIYKPITVTGDSYQPKDYWQEINIAKANGLLSDFNVEDGLKVEFRPIVA